MTLWRNRQVKFSAKRFRRGISQPLSRLQRQPPLHRGAMRGKGACMLKSKSERSGMRENGFSRPLSQTSLRSVRQLSLKGEPRDVEESHGMQKGALRWKGAYVPKSKSERSRMRESGFSRPLSQTSLRSVRQLSLKGEPRDVEESWRRIQLLAR